MTSPAAENESFGPALALFGDLLVAGAGGADIGAIANQGRACLFSLCGVSAVPLPAAAPLLAVAAGGLALARRRRG